MKQSKKTEPKPEASRGRGRPEIPDKDRKRTHAIRMTDADWLKFRRLGGANWLRAIFKTSP